MQYLVDFTARDSVGANSVKCSTLHSQGLSWSKLSETQYTSQPGTQLEQTQ